MKLRNVKTATLVGNTAKPVINQLSTRNKYKASKSPISTNNISEIEQKETINQNFQNSMMTLDISFNETPRNQEEIENYNLYKKYLISKTDYNKLISEISYVDNKIKDNTKLIENLSNNLNKLKEEKKEKNVILVDLLSNKESLEEIYKIKISSLKSNYQMYDTTKINGQNANGNDNNESPFATINILDNKDNIEIKTEDIQLSNKEKFFEQVINFAEDIAYKKDLDVRNRLLQKLNVGYQRFLSEISSPVSIETDKIVTNFFSKISIFIANQNRGLYPEPLINSLLKQLLKINRINFEISEILKFLNKKYKEKKVELKETINTLTNKNENLKNKKLSYENRKNDLKKFIEENRDKVKSGKNKINLENGNKQCMSFIFDNHFQEDLDFLNDGDKNDENPKKIRNNEKNNSKRKNNTIEKDSNGNFNHIKVLKVNKTNEKLNGINSINVNNLLINNNINIENNNILSERTYKKNKLNNIPKITNDDKYKSNRNVIMIKEMKMIKDLKSIPLKKMRYTPQKPNVFHSPSKINKTNVKSSMLFPISKSLINNKSISPSRTRTLNFNEANKTFKNNSYNSNYKLIAQDMSETFCYFKLSDNSNSKFDPLNSNGRNPIKFNYFEGSILIDNVFNKLKISQKKSEQKYIGIDLKDIVDVQLSEEMDKIIKVYNVYLKDGKNQENFDVNKFVSSNTELASINLTQNEKIKAINCKFFILSIIMGKRFVPKAEFIFDNYESFDSWFNCLQSVAKLNNPDKDKKEIQ